MQTARERKKGERKRKREKERDKQTDRRTRTNTYLVDKSTGPRPRSKMKEISTVKTKYIKEQEILKIAQCKTKESVKRTDSKN